MKKAISIILVVIMCFSGLVISASAAPTTPNVSAQAALVMNLDNKAIVLDKNSDVTMDPSLLAQVMTSILVLENYKDIKDDKVTVSMTVQNKMYDKKQELGALRLANINAGETLSVSDLLASVIIRSACDSAMTLAEYIGGSESDFVAMMNKKAKEIGANNTVFTSSHGIYDSSSTPKTTAQDMAKIIEYAMQFDEFKTLMGQTSYSYTKNGQTYSWKNINLLLDRSSAQYYNANATGAHFGFHDKITDTKNYGSYLIATYSAKSGNFLVITMGSKVSGDDNASFYKAFLESNELYKWASTNFEDRVLLESGKNLGEVKLRLAKGGKDYLRIQTGGTYSAYICKNPEPVPEYSLDVPVSVDAPIKEGDQVGTVTIKLDGEEVATVPVVSSETVEVSRGMLTANKLGKMLSSTVFIVIILVIFIGIALYVAFAVMSNKKASDVKTKKLHIKFPKLRKSSKNPDDIQDDLTAPKFKKKNDDDKYFD